MIPEEEKEIGDHWRKMNGSDQRESGISHQRAGKVMASGGKLGYTCKYMSLPNQHDRPTILAHDLPRTSLYERAGNPRMIPYPPIPARITTINMYTSALRIRKRGIEGGEDKYEEGAIRLCPIQRHRQGMGKGFFAQLERCCFRPRKDRAGGLGLQATVSLRARNLPDFASSPR